MSDDRCGWRGPFDEPCHFTAGHGSAHSQLGGSEDDCYGPEHRHRIFQGGAAKDTRSKRDKLEAMANQTASPKEAEVAKRKLAEHDKAHPLFRHRRGADDPDGTRNMPHDEFMRYMHRKRGHFWSGAERDNFVGHHDVKCASCGYQAHSREMMDRHVRDVHDSPGSEGMTKDFGKKKKALGE